MAKESTRQPDHDPQTPALAAGDLIAFHELGAGGVIPLDAVPVSITFPSGASMDIKPHEHLIIDDAGDDFVQFTHSGQPGKFKTSRQAWADCVAPHVVEAVADPDPAPVDLDGGAAPDPEPAQGEQAPDPDPKTPDGPLGIVGADTLIGSHFILPDPQGAVIFGGTIGAPAADFADRQIAMHWGDDGSPAFDDPVTVAEWNGTQALDVEATGPYDGRGDIADDTPIGRVVRFSDGRPDQIPEAVYRVVELNDAKVVLGAGIEGAGDRVNVDRASWAAVAPFVMFALDPPADDQVAPAEPAQGEAAEPEAAGDDPVPASAQISAEQIANGPTIAVPACLIEAAQAAREELAEAQQAFAFAAEARRQAKDTLESKQDVYNQASLRVITYRTSGFEPATPMAQAVEANSGDPDDPAVEAPAADPEPSADPEAWRAETIDGLDLGNRPRNALVNAGLETMGDLADWMQAKGDFWAKDVKGLGAKSAGEIADAMVDFWAAHPEYCGRGDTEGESGAAA